MGKLPPAAKKHQTASLMDHVKNNTNASVIKHRGGSGKFKEPPGSEVPPSTERSLTKRPNKTAPSATPQKGGGDGI
jgi:hypothetical protein